MPIDFRPEAADSMGHPRPIETLTIGRLSGYPPVGSIRLPMHVLPPSEPLPLHRDNAPHRRFQELDRANTSGIFGRSSLAVSANSISRPQTQPDADDIERCFLHAGCLTLFR